MASERIIMDVGKENTNVKCIFVFKNDGPACKVRMGFPDNGAGAYQTEAGENEAEAKEKGKKVVPFSAMNWFKSTVDGKPVTTTLINGDIEAGPFSWHTKTVSFQRGQTRRVIDTYQVATGTAITAANTAINEAHYTMSTGASWKGGIGSVTIVIRFALNIIDVPLKPLPVSSLGVKYPSAYEGWKSVGKGAVYYAGFAKPVAAGRTLTFTATNLEPTKSSDIQLYFPRTQ